MARIRTIKPQFFRNPDLAQLSFAHRLLFAGLWTQADRAGRLLDRPNHLKIELFPCDTKITAAKLDGMLEDLATNPPTEKVKFITRYVIDGTHYIQVNKFLDHQHPHIKEPESTIPAPCENSASTGLEPCPPVGRERKGIKIKDGRAPALRAFMSHTNQALKTKTGKPQPATARKIYGIAAAFIADHPDRQVELSREIDLLPRAREPSWYPQAVRSWIGEQRWAEVKALPPSEEIKALTAGIGRAV